MGHTKVREPKQKRSIEKKNKIMKAGYELFCEKGYHGTNTAEIAKKAGVSTGIVYNYFHNKKEIFMECLDKYSESIVSPIYQLLDQTDSLDDISEQIELIIDKTIEAHTVVKQAHQEMMAMSYSDPDVAAYFIKWEEDVTKGMVKILSAKGITDQYLHEKLHIVYNLMENIAHEAAYHFHSCMNIEVMKREVIKLITCILKGME